MDRMILVDDVLSRSIQMAPSGCKRASALSQSFIEAVDHQLHHLQQSFHRVPAIIRTLRQLENHLTEIQALQCLATSDVGPSLLNWRGGRGGEAEERVSSSSCVALQLLVVSCSRSTSYLLRVLDVVSKMTYDLNGLKNPSVPLIHPQLMEIEGGMDVMIRDNIADLQFYHSFARKQLDEVKLVQ
jgi:hypothetical protein